jgi:acetolactate synthase-1/2/3 large subunit
MKGDRVVAKILKAEGVEWMSCFPAQGLIGIAAEEGIRPILCRQERAGVNIADGFSRVNNGSNIGVFTMQAGPGAENAFAGVAQAFADSVPVLVLPNGVGTARAGVHPNFSAVDNYKGITKWSGYVNSVELIPDFMRRAFTKLKNGPKGPVLIEIPTDVAEQEFPDEQFQYEPVKVTKSQGDPDNVRELISAILKAELPVINAGQGVLYSESSEELIEFVELTGIPVMTTLAGKSSFPETHQLSLGTGGVSSTLMVDHFRTNSDLIIGIGTSFTKSNFNAPMPSNVALAQITDCADHINKDWKISLGCVGDAKLILKQMIEEYKKQNGIKPLSNSEKVSELIDKLRNQFYTEWNPRLNSDEIPLSPYRVLTELASTIDVSNTIITHDSGYPRDQFSPFWKPVNPWGYIGWGKSTQLGYGLGLAIGAKLAKPEKHVINIMGDAAFGMAGLDIETAVRSNIPILTVVLNNGVMTNYTSPSPYLGYAAEKWDLHKLTGDYAKIADGLGAFSKKVRTPDQIVPAIKEALEANKSGQPALLEMMTKEELNVPKFW